MKGTGVKPIDNFFGVTLDGLPPSMNRIWRIRKGGRGNFKDPLYVEWEVHVQGRCLAQGDFAKFRAYAKRPYRIEIEVISKSWTYSTGNPKKPDVTNFIKAAEDAVCRVFGWDDAWCVNCEVTKVTDPTAMTDKTRIGFWFE